MNLLFNNQIRTSGILLIATSLLMLPTQWLLTTPSTPSGIADLELAGNAVNFASIMHLWANDPNYSDVTWAVHASVWMDFLFLAAYTLLLHGLAVRCTERLTDSNNPGPLLRALTKNGQLATKGFLLAGACDILENICLLIALYLHPGDTSVFFAGLFASVKFLALLYGLIFLLVAWLCIRKNPMPQT